VAICARNERDLLEAKREIEEKTGGRVIARTADVTNGDSVENLVRYVVDEFAAVDILVCNAGGPPSGPIGDFGPDDYRKALELNLLSTIALCREVVPHMKERGWGRIVNVTSVSAKQPIDTLVLSNTARAGVLGYSKTLANQMAPFGITVNAVCPGYTKTERVEALAKSHEESGKGDAREFFKAVERTIPMGRLGRPEELAAAVVFLCSDAASYITGVALQIDGGYVKSIY
jgi:3-oxoacyl-[acyl-carrier protein] reductase